MVRDREIIKLKTLMVGGLGEPCEGKLNKILITS